MARKKVPRALPPLPRLAPLRAGEHKAERLREILRRVAITNQKEAAQPFYSLREVARHFRVSFATVAGAYARLEKDGILRRIRGSKTLLLGKGAVRPLSVQGLVGLPAALSCLVTLQDYRTFFMCTRSALRRRGFVSETVHFETRDLREGILSERLKACQADTVIWYLPEVASRDTVARLRDAGIRVLGVSDGGLPGFPCRYEVRRGAARRQILQAWAASGEIEKIFVVSVPRRRSAADAERLQVLLEEGGWEFALVSLSAQRPALPSFPERSGIVLQACAASLLSFRAPELLAELLQRRRVALVDGPVSAPFSRFPTGARADLVYVDWEAVAEQMANDLVRRDPARDGAVIAFEAEARPRVAVGDYAQRI